MSRKATRGRKPGLEPTSADEGPWLEPGEAKPGLLLFADEPVPALEPALASGAVAAIVVPPNAVPAWRELRRRYGMALLARDEPDAEANGVHLAAAAEVAAARARLGRHAVIGASCGRSRHAGMVAGEAGADYVMFGDLDRAGEAGDELFELVGWWSELFVIPCAAAVLPDPDLAAGLVASGADLVALAAAVSDLERIVAVADAVAAVGAGS